jgi:hypothetical protein
MSELCKEGKASEGFRTPKFEKTFGTRHESQSLDLADHRAGSLFL